MKKTLLLVMLLGALVFPSLLWAECEHYVEMPPNPELWCCPNVAAQLLCWEALGKPFGEEVCKKLGCNGDSSIRDRGAQEEKKKKEEAEQEKAQAEFNKKRAQERSRQQMQEWFNKKKQEIRDQQRAKEEEAKRDREQEKLDQYILDQEQRDQPLIEREIERADREKNRFPPPLLNPQPSQSEPSRPSGDVWAGVSAGMRYQAEKLKAEHDTWNRNFPNQKREYPLWIQRFFGRGI